METSYKLKCEIFIDIKETEDGELIAEARRLYDCDPKLNTECRKTGCGECTRTTKLRFAKRYGIFE